MSSERKRSWEGEIDEDEILGETKKAGNVAIV